MKKLTLLIAAVMMFCFTAPLFAAPVFPDVPEEHWARDAVASLAANGIVEGYPDGTFKGDRAATRYEMAMVIARLIAKMEQENANFATKADLDALRNLVDQLKSELDALGVRVTNLEDAVGKLDKRVTELERITFYGELEARFVSQSFESCDTERIFNGAQWVTEENALYQDYVTKPDAFDRNLYLNGLMPVIDYTNGRPLPSGSGLTALAKFGVNAKLSDEFDAGLELVAYTSLGDDYVNNLYGVDAPIYHNNFANFQGGWNSNSLSGNSPWTRVTLDNFWIKHKTSGFKLVVGSFGDTNMDPILFAGHRNPNVNGSEFLSNSGVKISGTAHLFSDMDWEVFYSNIASYQFANPATVNYSNSAYAPNSEWRISDLQTPYNTNAYGIDLNWNFKNGNFKIGYLRLIDDRRNYNEHGNFAQPQADNRVLSYGPGGISAIMPSEFNNHIFLNWVNPSGYYTSNLNATPADATHQAGWMNRQPIYGGDNARGVFGPQASTNWSARLNYSWEDSKLKPRFFAEYASSNYKPNESSDYSKTGSALRAGIGLTFFNDSLDLDVSYKAIEPWYDPFYLTSSYYGHASLYYMPGFEYYGHAYQLHDSEIYTNNREGWTFKLTYRFKDEKGKIWAQYDALQQKETSKYDVFLPATTFAQGGPSANVFGYEPGFVDAFFHPYAIESYYPLVSAAPGTPIDDQKGKANKLSAGFDYTFSNNYNLNIGYYNQTFKRDTDLFVGQVVSVPMPGGLTANMNVAAAASVNYVDLQLNGFHIGLNVPFNEKFSGRIGYDYTTVKGHYDPSGLWNKYALQVRDHAFDNVDMKQSSPWIGFDYKLTKNTECGIAFKYFDTKDNIDAVLPTPAVADRTINPFSWKGTQLTTHFKVKF